MTDCYIIMRLSWKSPNHSHAIHGVLPINHRFALRYFVVTNLNKSAKLVAENAELKHENSKLTQYFSQETNFSSQEEN